MKKISFTLLFLALFATQSRAQTALADALTLKSHVDLAHSKFKSDSASEAAVVSLLKKYIPENGLNGYPNLITFTKPTGRHENPFIYAFIPIDSSGSPIGSAPFIKAAASTALSAFGGTDVTAFADGLGKFLAERTKEEINIAFFERFRLLLKDYPELGTVFPATVKYLDVVMNHEYANMLTTLKEAFERDLKALPKNLIALSNLNAGNCKCGSKKKQADCEKRMAQMAEFFGNQNGNLIIATLYVVDGLLSKDAAPQIIANIAGNAHIRRSHSELGNLFKLMGILSNSVRNPNYPERWLRPAELKPLLDDPILFNLYVGLVYQQIHNENIQIGGVDIRTKIDPKMLNGLREYLEKLVTDGETFVVDLQKMRNRDSVTVGSVNRSIESFQSFFNSATNYRIIHPDIPEPSDKAKLGFYITNQGLDITQNILVKNYAAAVLSSLYLLDSLLETDTYTTRKGAIRINGKTTLDSLTLKGIKAEYKLDERPYQNKKEVMMKDSAKVLTKATKEKIKAYGDADVRVDSAYRTYVQKTLKKKSDSYVRDRYLTKLDFKRNFLRYGTFMANVILSKNSDDVKKTIRAVALPPGSASIKKNTNFSITLQAYTGFSGGREVANLGVPASQGVFFNALSIYAPVGVAFNLGLKSHRNPINKSNGGSLSAMFSIIDVGAIFSYRFKDPDSPLADSVKIRLENIFAPGVNLVYGIPKVPLSIGTGIQWQPSLTRLSSEKATIGNIPGVRWQLFLVFDLPMLNLYTSRK